MDKFVGFARLEGAWGGGGSNHCERRFGSFRRDMVLPGDVDTNRVDAAYNDGVLTVTLPKTELAKAKTVKIKS